MPYANLLVHVEDDDESDARINLAISLAKRFGASLTGVAAASADMLAVTNAVDLEYIESGLRSCASRFRRISKANQMRTLWRSRIDHPAKAVSLHAMTADLVLAGRRAEAMLYAPRSAFDPADVIMKSGRPVLVVPPGMPSLSGERVVIGWKNTREARRAVIDALPLLQVAAQVTVLGFARLQDMPDVREQTQQVSEYLRSHGVKVASAAEPFRNGTTAEQLIGFAERDKADLIVTGAYGHTWLHEWIFGGVTQVLLRRSPVCCLMSH